MRGYENECLAGTGSSRRCDVIQGKRKDGRGCEFPKTLETSSFDGAFSCSNHSTSMVCQSQILYEREYCHPPPTFDTPAVPGQQAAYTCQRQCSHYQSHIRTHLSIPQNPAQTAPSHAGDTVYRVFFPPFTHEYCSMYSNTVLEAIPTESSTDRSPMSEARMQII